MKQLLLATVLIAVPVAVFGGFNIIQAGATVPLGVPAADLGDLSALKAIVTDVQAIAAKGDLAGARTRITDWETAWDTNQGTLRPKNPNAWGAIDDASDAALSALRSSSPDAAKVKETLTALMASLNAPGQSVGATVAATLVSGIAVTDASGRALPCEIMLKSLKSGLATSPKADADKGRATDFLAKATERCNADDDQRADAFSAQGLAIITK